MLINLDTTEELITQSPTEPIFDGIKVVTSSPDQSLQQPIECAIKELGGLDILINNVLPLPDIAPVEQQTTEAFKAAFNRIECAAMAMQYALPALIDSGHGRIINVGHRYGESVNRQIGA